MGTIDIPKLGEPITRATARFRLGADRSSAVVRVDFSKSRLTPRILCFFMSRQAGP